jgi:hypothetical protein
MALTPLKVGRGEGVAFKEGKSRRARYGFDSASSRCGAGRWGGRRRPDSAVARSGSGDARGRR